MTITDRLTTGSVVDGATTINLLPHTFVEDSFVLSCFVEGTAAGVTTPQPWPATWVPVFNDAKTEFTLTIDAAAEGPPCGDFSRMHLAYKTQPVGDAVKNTPAHRRSTATAMRSTWAGSPPRRTRSPTRPAAAA